MEESGLTSGNSSWPQKYHKTVNEIISSLVREKKASEEYGETAKEWNEGVPPEGVGKK